MRGILSERLVSERIGWGEASDSRFAVPMPSSLAGSQLVKKQAIPLPLFSLTNSAHSCLPRCGYRIFQSHPLWSILIFWDMISGQGFLN
jgi:hypothetical protein